MAAAHVERAENGWLVRGDAGPSASNRCGKVYAARSPREVLLALASLGVIPPDDMLDLRENGALVEDLSVQVPWPMPRPEDER